MSGEEVARLLGREGKEELAEMAMLITRLFMRSMMSDVNPTRLFAAALNGAMQALKRSIDGQGDEPKPMPRVSFGVLMKMDEKVDWSLTRDFTPQDLTDAAVKLQESILNRRADKADTTP